MNNIRKFYWASFFGSWSFVTGILVFHYRELGFSFFQIFLLAAIYEGLNFLLEIPTGILADSWGYKKTVVSGCLISALSFFVVLRNSEVYSSYIIWAVLSAICTTLNSGTYDAFIYECVKRKEELVYSEILGTIRFISFSTQAVCIILGGFFSDAIGFNLALLLSGIGGLVQTGILVTLPEIERVNNIRIDFKSNLSNQVSKIIGSSVSEIRRSFLLQSMLFIGILIFVNIQFVNTIFQPFLEKMGYRTNLVVAAFSALSMFFMAMGAKSIKKISEAIQSLGQNLLLLLLFSSLSLFFMFSNYAGLVAFAFLFFVFGAVEVIYSSEINTMIPSDIRATLLSFQNQLCSLVYAVVAIGIGWLMEKVQLSIVSASIGIGSIFLLLLVYWSMRKQKELTRNC